MTTAASAPAVSLSLGALVSLFRDNPVLGKDAALLGRRRRTLAAWALAALGLVAIAAMASVGAAQEPRQWGSYHVVGPQMLLTVFGLSFAALSVLVTALAATSITVEREGGTLPLLLVSGLSPARIVAGKLGGLLAVTLPFLAIVFPLLALSSFFLGVDVDVVVVAVAGLVAHAVAVAAAGLWASAVTSRVRNALLLAFVAAGVPTFVGGLTVFGSLVMVLDDHMERGFLIGAVGVIVELVCAAVFAVGAWSAMAPLRAPRWAVGKRLLVLALGVVPLVAAVAMFATGEREELRAMLAFLVTTVAGLTCLLGPALTGVSDTPTPARLSLGLFVAGMGVTLATAAVAIALHNGSGSFDDRDAGQVASFVAICFAGCGVVAAFARHIQNPVAPVVLTVGLFVGLAIVPALFDPFVVGKPPFAFLSLPYAMDRSDVEVPLTLAFYGGLGGLAFVFGRGPRAGTRKA